MNRVKMVRLGQCSAMRMICGKTALIHGVGQGPSGLKSNCISKHTWIVRDEGCQGNWGDLISVTAFQRPPPMTVPQTETAMAATY